MTSAAPAAARFIAFFGELGPRWGLDADGCRAHACLYLAGAPLTPAELATASGLAPNTVRSALAYLDEFGLVTQAGSGWRTGDDPWDMLVRGLEERRRRELGPALDTLRACHREARADRSVTAGSAARIERLLRLVEDLAALDVPARRVSPRLLRGLLGASATTARLFDRAFGGRARGSHEP